MTPLSSIPDGPPVVTTFGELRVVAGPDAGRTFPVAAGRSILGRANGLALIVRDEYLEPHHLLVEAKGTGIVWVTQLSGRLPILVDGQPTERAVLTAAGADLELGATRLEWCPVASRSQPENGLSASNTTAMPTIGLVDSADRAFGLDTGQPSRRRGQTVALSPGLRELTIVGSDVGPCLRAVLGQFANLGWSVHSTHPDAICTRTADPDSNSSNDQTRQVVVVQATRCGDDVSERELHRSDVRITVTDDETGLDATGNIGAAIIIGGRSRGRYSADVHKLATIRLHLVGWHPTTFAASIRGTLSRSNSPR